MAREFLCVLFWDELQKNDLEFIESSSSDAPGVAKLRRAKTGTARPDAPNSRPLLSGSGANIGYVADISLLDGPYHDVFLL